MVATITMVMMTTTVTAKVIIIVIVVIVVVVVVATSGDGCHNGDDNNNNNCNGGGDTHNDYHEGGGDNGYWLMIATCGGYDNSSDNLIGGSNDNDGDSTVSEPTSPVVLNDSQETGASRAPSHGLRQSRSTRESQARGRTRQAGGHTHGVPSRSHEELSKRATATSTSSPSPSSPHRLVTKVAFEFVAISSRSSNRRNVASDFGLWRLERDMVTVKDWLERIIGIQVSAEAVVSEVEVEERE
ncbi:hypothetical protein E2542_SST21457 [Spatholobus suberectus]|nr:hypothetical protein E2542_SST21457 [Spatholobus suberectus]